MHCDKANNFEYDISCILYLNDEGEDFQGGEFVFMDTIPADTKIEITTKKKDGYSAFSNPISSPLPYDVRSECREEIEYSLCKSDVGTGANINYNISEKENGCKSSQSKYAAIKFRSILTIVVSMDICFLEVYAFVI